MGTFADTIGVASSNETAFKYGLDEIAECVMYHPVTKRSGADETLLWLMNGKGVIAAGAVGAITQFRLQLQ